MFNVQTRRYTRDLAYLTANSLAIMVIRYGYHMHAELRFIVAWHFVGNIKVKLRTCELPLDSP